MMVSLTSKSMERPVKSGQVVGDGLFDGKCQYFTYCLMGKRANQSVKLAALSFACQLGSILQNPSIIKVVAGGGVYRNSKLQMGSVIPLAKGKATE